MVLPINPSYLFCQIYIILYQPLSLQIKRNKLCYRDSYKYGVKYIALFSAKKLLVSQIDSQRGERYKQWFSPEGRLSVKIRLFLTVDRKLSDLIFTLQSFLIKIDRMDSYLFIKYELSRVVTWSNKSLFLL